MFQIKDFASIVAGELNHARAVTDKITDFAPGSVARTIMEAPAVEIEELYLQMFLGLRDAIPVATFKSFGFDKLPAKKARGWVVVTAATAPTAASLVAKGTSFSTADGARSYLSTADVTWGVGALSVRVPVECTVAGLVGNAAAGEITVSSAFGSGYTVGNSLIATGADAESDADREARFAGYISSLSSGTVAACLYSARSATVLDADGNISEYVARAGLTEIPGIVSVYLYGSGGAPSAELLADAQARLDGSRDDSAGTITPGVRSAGVRVDALPMVERAIPMALTVTMLSGYTLSTATRQALTAAYDTAIRSILPSSELLIAQLVAQLLTVEGVKSVVTNATSNIVCGADEALIPGVLTIS